MNLRPRLYQHLRANCATKSRQIEASMSTFQQPNKQVLIRKRSEAVVGYRGRWQVSASGYMRPCHTDDNNVPSPFVTAAREATQELSDRLADSMSEYKMIGIGMHWHGLYPSFYGYIETGLTAKEIMGDACRDNYEGSISAIEFSPNAVLSHLSENPWTPMSCVAMIAALNVHFGPTGRAEIERIARSVRAVTPDSFRR